MIDIHAPPDVRPGEELSIRISVITRQTVAPGEVSLKIFLSSGATPIGLEPKELAAGDPGSTRAAEFVVSTMAPLVPGAYEIMVDVEGVGTYDEYILVAGK